MNKLQLLLDEIEREPSKATGRLPLLLKEIYVLIERIKSCPDMQSASAYFTLLAKIQSALARITFRDGIALDQELSKIVRDCDRLDDEDVRNFLFDEIRSGTYDLTQGKF